MGKGHKRFGWKYSSASRAGNTIYNPFPGAMTTLFPLSWHQRFQWEFSLCPCQASSGADARLPSCPSPLGQPSGWLRGAVMLFGPAPGSNNSSGKLFAPSAPFQVAWRNGAKTQQTEVQSIVARNRNKTVLTITTEHRKGCPGLSAHRAKRGVLFVPGAAAFVYESLWVYQHFHCVRK